MKKGTADNLNVQIQEADSADAGKADKLTQIVELSLLYDFYGELLKEQQKQIFEDYILNDYSLSEIAALQGISRQGIHDTIKRCSRQLAEYDEKLRLIDKFNQTKDRVNQIKKYAEQTESSVKIPEMKEIVKLADEIIKIL